MFSPQLAVTTGRHEDAAEIFASELLGAGRNVAESRQHASLMGGRHVCRPCDWTWGFLRAPPGIDYRGENGVDGFLWAGIDLRAALW